MKHVVQFGFLVFGLSALLLTSGCEGGGSGGSGSLFDGGGVALSSFAGGGDSSNSAATVTQPEPASIALFGGGLAGLALWRRRKARKRS